METGPGTGAWTPFEQISPFLVQTVLGHEDGGFYGHHGFSVGAIRLALIRNLREGRYVQGASTITMQLVKNVFLHREKTLARKVQEVLLTWWIESVMPKDRILELYLNVIEYGPAIYGIRHAAWHYFGKTPAQLGPAEAAYLAMILPNPKAYHYQWAQNAIPESFRQRVARFIHTLGSRGRFDQATVDRGIAELATLAFHHGGELPVAVPEGEPPPEDQWDDEPPPPDEW
jgi:membrane peptidoglycan carboxypeptidase